MAESQVSAESASVNPKGERFSSNPIRVGKLWMGGSHPIVIQSMTTTDTMKVEDTVVQAKALAEAGCEVIRITAPTIQDAEALKEIRDRLRAEGVETPLVADIHFVPAAAMVAADFVDKVRINPGNYADRKMFKTREYTDAEYAEELARIREKFVPLVEKIQAQGKALRIGTNHGSLSDRIMNRFGDTPQGMVESAFEFAQICHDLNFRNFCFSMKASNVRVMVEAYRLLVDRQREKGWAQPIHLGVTEAGDGEDGRLKSAIGIGALLLEGIGDTIRVSLTEAAVKEIPVCEALRKRFPRTRVPFRREYSLASGAKNFEGVPEVWWSVASFETFSNQMASTKLRPDVLFFTDPALALTKKPAILERVGIKNPLRLALQWNSNWWAQLDLRQQCLAEFDFFVGVPKEISLPKPTVNFTASLADLKQTVDIDPSKTLLAWKAAPSLSDLDFVIDAALEAGVPFVDLGLRGIMISDEDCDRALRTSFGILQATRRRMSKTEYISCPSCGRTLFDLESTTARIKSVTGHLKNVKIAVMGCIVNGPGEMADADFGYVGGAPGKVNLYVGKECVERNIASDEAPDRLVALIKRYDRWIDPETTH